MYEDSQMINNLDYYNPNKASGIINTELVPKPYEGMFKSRLNEPAVQALRYYLGQDNVEPFYDISEFETPRGPHKEVDEGLLGQFNPDEKLMPGVPHPLYADQIGIVDDRITKDRSRKDTAWHELLHWYETNYGLAGYMNDSNRYRKNEPSRWTDWNKLERGFDAHKLIRGLQHGTSSMNPKDQRYKRSWSKNEWNEIMKTYEDSRKANINENYAIMEGPNKLDRTGDMAVRSDIDYTYKPAMGPVGPPGQPVTGRHIGYNTGGIASLVL